MLVRLTTLCNILLGELEPRTVYFCWEKFSVLNRSWSGILIYLTNTRVATCRLTLFFPTNILLKRAAQTRYHSNGVASATKAPSIRVPQHIRSTSRSVHVPKSWSKFSISVFFGRTRYDARSTCSTPHYKRGVFFFGNSKSLIGINGLWYLSTVTDNTLLRNMR